MSLTLTTLAHTRRVTIDLTLSPDTPTPSQGPSPLRAPLQAGKLQRPRTWTTNDAPSPKRQNLGKSRPARKIKECLGLQLVPVVREATQHLSRSNLDVDAIGKRVIVKLAGSRDFKLRVDQTSGYLTKDDIQHLKEVAKTLVENYRLNPEYHIRTGLHLESKPTPPSPVQSVPILRTGSQSQPTRATVPPRQGDPECGTWEQGFSGPFQDVSLPQSLERRKCADRTFEPTKLPWPCPVRSRISYPSRRPYCSAAERQQVRLGTQILSLDLLDALDPPLLFHVDFSPEEVASIVGQVCARIKQPFQQTREGLRCLIRFEHIPSRVEPPPGRTSEDLRSFFSDLMEGREELQSRSCNILSLQRKRVKARQPDLRGARATPLLLAREMEGNAGYGRTRRHVNFQKDFTRLQEDGLELVAAYHGGAGDIDTFAWVSNEAFVCGTTAHSDTFNQQYNKPGNLLLCSTKEGQLRSYPGHRIERPTVASGENASEEMRQSQDPWLYTSVAASDYDPHLKLAYTASYDKTVKAWKVDDQGRRMECVATWQHDEVVNFVQCAKDDSGRVATASNCVNKPAVRIYVADPDNMPLEPYQVLSCTREDYLKDGGKWAYYPATIAWGKGPMAQHLLAIGYSPRAESGHDSDIPEDKVHTGEVMLYDAVRGKVVDISNATTANVFEIVWHPVLPRFACATSPCGLFVRSGTRTQIHIFKRDPDSGDPDSEDLDSEAPQMEASSEEGPSKKNRRESYFSSISLDCPACDINEITYVPNSLDHAYVTAACTDGRVYIWDTAFENDIKFILKHGDSLEKIRKTDEITGQVESDEEYLRRREIEDTGVKFTAWGRTLDRFYTGGCDGIVNVWNIQDKQPFVRKLLTKAAAPISGGGFSPNGRKLAIGDAGGRVWLFSIDERDVCESHYRTCRFRGYHRSDMPVIPHPEPPPPPSRTSDPMDIDEIKDSNDTEITPPTSVEENDISEDNVAAYCQRVWLDTNQLVYSGQCKVGMVQGPNYPSSNRFCPSAHIDEDPTQPLLHEDRRNQQEHIEGNTGPRPIVYRSEEPTLTAESRRLHLGHTQRDAVLKQVYGDHDGEPTDGIAKDGKLAWKFAYDSEGEHEDEDNI